MDGTTIRALHTEAKHNRMPWAILGDALEEMGFDELANLARSIEEHPPGCTYTIYRHGLLPEVWQAIEAIP